MKTRLCLCCLLVNLAVVTLARRVETPPGDYNGIDATTTYVSNFEKAIKRLSSSSGVLSLTARISRNVLETLWNRVPFRGLLSSPSSEGESRGVNYVIDSIGNRLRAIFPGTLWCGDGDIAQEATDLGYFNNTDLCCREHDKCFAGIAASEERFGLTNSGVFTRSHCDCDEEFYTCLKEVRTIVASNVGFTYFNILRPQCFKEDHPIVSCLEYRQGRLRDPKCLNYEKATGEPKRMQWFDNPDF